MKARVFALVAALGLAVAADAEARRPRHTLVIEKSARRMTLFVGKSEVKRFRVGLGGAPAGDKVRQGDSRTPEGRFYVAWKNPKSNFHRFLGLSYPMPRHARRAVAQGRLSAKARAKIDARIAKKGIPPQTTPLGGYVGIHGGGGDSDWTLGCIAITDDEIEWLYTRMRRGDVIEVRP